MSRVPGGVFPARLRPVGAVVPFSARQGRAVTAGRRPPVGEALTARTRGGARCVPSPGERLTLRACRV
jgi:hypothetical protein